MTRELGVANTLRFMMQFSSREDNYTEERKALFGDVTLDEVVEEMGKTRKQYPQTLGSSPFP